uniref:GNAT family N-acetyltransferase n=1 Tax=Fervidicoccus fontis TaxID=683846 RepID=A0A7J3ZKB3_9CREN
MSETVNIEGKVIEIRRPKSPKEYQEIVRAQMETWGMRDATTVVSHHMLIAADRRGGLVLGAFEKDTGRVVGFCFGILARAPDGRLYHYSHMTGVIPEYRYKGLGFHIKLKQREHVIRQGLDLISWTYDPLQAANAKFNVCKLGAIVRRFYIDYYGELTDSINYGMPTDRFEAEWWIKSRLVEMKVSGQYACPPLESILDMGGRFATKSELVGEYRVLRECSLAEGSPLLLVEIPEDLNALRGSSNVLMEWRIKLRELFEHYINKEGYVVAEVVTAKGADSRRVLYLLWRGDVERLLEGEVPWRSKG